MLFVAYSRHCNIRRALLYQNYYNYRVDNCGIDDRGVDNRGVDDRGVDDRGVDDRRVDDHELTKSRLWVNYCIFNSRGSA